MGELSQLELFYAFLGGCLGGFLNTLASSGSAVTLPLLVFLGLHPLAANATNRLGIVTGALTSVWIFHREGVLDYKPALKVCLWPWAGAALGAYLATRISDQQTEEVILVAVIASFILILMGSRRFLLASVAEPKSLGAKWAAILFLIGVWAGFIVLDSATFLLLAFVLGLGIELKHANAYKALALLGIALISVVVFWGNSALDWSVGAALAVGNVVGSAVAARCAVLKGANVWVYRLFVLVVTLELVKMVWQMV